MTSTNNNRDKVEEIKGKLDIVDVIGRDISLHDNGNGEYVGSVPPIGKSGQSLKVDRQQQLWYDMKNGRGGDAFDWIGRDFSDPKGKDFPDVLRAAASLAGVELEDMTAEEKEAAAEKAAIHDLLTEATEIYHGNLKPFIYDNIKEKWGITPETVDRFKIGYATGGRDIEELDNKTLCKSGLVYASDGRLDSGIFNCRIIFPYWKNGKAVYMIGRSTSKTPRRKDGSEPAKYQKLLVHGDKFPYVSPSVQNAYFYGEDSLRGFDYCIITEGVTDCIVMLQACFPCISPVTVQFRENDHPRLINLTKRMKRVYICNDNETNNAGINGALSTAETLENAGIEARIIELPKPDDVDKIDIADYMKKHSPEDFKALMVSSVRLWTYKLSKRKVPVTKLDKRRAFEDFIVDDLKGMPYADWELFVTNDATKHFGLNKKEAKPTIDKVRGSVKEFDFDLDSVSGRNAIYRAFADEYITEHHVKCINGKLRLYKDGVYPDSDEAIEFIQSEIMNIGLSQGVNLAENNIIAILRLIELSTRIRMAE